MNPIRLPKHPLPSIAAVLLGLALASGAPAQSGTWKWLDAQGRTVYSDRPPPPGVRVTQLKAPGGHPAGVSSTTPAGHSADAADVAAQPVAAPATASWVEREKQSRLRAAQRAEAEARQAEESRQAADLQRSCEETRAGLRTLESGQRVQVLDARGERVVLDDAERTRRGETLRRVLSENCERQPS